MYAPNSVAPTRFLKAGQLDQLVGRRRIGHREYSLSVMGRRAWLIRNRGYVALAVATEIGTYKRELSTGLGGDREGNMIAFAAEALGLLRDVIKGDAKL